MRRAGEAMVTDVLEFRETGWHIARVTDRTLEGVKLDRALVSCHYGLTRRIVGPERLLVSRIGFIGDSHDFGLKAMQASKVVTKVVTNLTPKENSETIRRVRMVRGGGLEPPSE